MEKSDTFPHIYCLFCRSGAEWQVVQQIQRRFEYIQPLPAVQEKHKVISGCYEVDRKVFLPGYLFLYSREPVESEEIQQIEDVYRLLGDVGDKELQGSDRAFARWLWMNRGVIGISKIQFVDGKLNVLDGPMCFFADAIVRVDKHTKNALVRMDFLGRKTDIWLAFEYVNG